AGAGAAAKVVEAVAIDVADGGVGAVAEGLFEDVEVAEELGAAVRAERHAAEGGHSGSAAEAGGDDEVAATVAVDIADGGTGSAAEVRVVDAVEVGDLGEARAGEESDARAAALVGGDGE